MLRCPDAPMLRGLALALVLIVLPSSPTLAAEPAPALHEMEVMGVGADARSGTPVVYLRGKTDKRELYMVVGRSEAQGIILPLQGITPPRPQTHDLMLAALHRLQARVKRVIITDLRDGVYFAELVLEAPGGELLLDARPSDAIALALREEVPILASEKALAAAPGEGEAAP